MIPKIIGMALSMGTGFEIKSRWLPTLLFCLGGNLVSINHASAQVWTQSGAPSKPWSVIASSGDGNVLAASTGTSIYVSTNSGKSWGLTTAPAKNWTALAASGNGKMLLAVNSSSGVYTSTNFGSTWLSNSVPPNANWAATAVSADGSTLIASAQVFGSVYYSTNAGMNWRSNGIPTGYWTGLACSADGTKLAAFWSGIIYTSTNSGGVWTSNNVSGGTVLACSADGRYLFRQNGAQLNISADWGTTWFTTTLPANSAALGISSNAQRLVLAYNGVTAISTNLGTNWISTYGPAKSWRAGAASYDTSRMAVVTTGTDGIYLWTPPVLSLTNVIGANFTVQWSTNGTPFGLQMNSDLTTNNWVAVPGAPVGTNSMDQVMVSATNNSAYFRLISQ
jgi:hypothetical protein